MRPDVRSDFEWGRQFIPEMKSIIGAHIIGEAPPEEDVERATDLIVLRLEAVRVACRIRRAKYLFPYGDEFTIRLSRPNGAETELSKVLAGWGDYIFYGFASEDGLGLAAWVLGNLHEFRRWHARQMWHLPAGQAPGALNHNHDDSSDFCAYQIAELPPDFVVARKRAMAVAA